MVAPRILWRYLLREVLLHTLLGLSVFTVVLVAQNLLRFLEQLLASGLSVGAVSQLVAIALPSYLAYALPTSILFGVLLTFGRMSADGEVVAMRAGGVSVPRLLPPVLALGALCAAITGYLLFELEPASRYRMKNFVRELGRAVELIEPGEFKNVGGRTVYVADSGDEACPFRGVLIGDLSQAPRPLYISARCAQVDAEVGLALDLYEGSIHFSDEESGRYRKISFEKMTISLDLDEIIAGKKRGQDFTMNELLDLRRRFAAGESPPIRGKNGARVVEVQIHRRLAFPLASIVLAMLAVPLGIRPLRSGRSAGAITALAVMGLYWCLFTAGEVAAERGLIPAWVGMWTPNVLVGTLSIVLLRRTIHGDT